MLETDRIYMGISKSDGHKIVMPLSQANRHGLIAGASGTGKTITMKVMAEAFSDAGVPVFMCDVKGDVSGICAPGLDNAGMQKRIDKFGIRDTFEFKGYPTTFWDIYGRGGHPVRTTISDMGPEILSRILELTEVQEGVLKIIFRVADDHGLKILDMKDLRAVIKYVNDHRAEYSADYGNMAPQSLNAISRALITLEDQGAETFFGEPALDLTDWIRTDASGKGMINVLHSVESIRYPKLYAAFLLWMMAELYELLPEVGDLDKPVMVFFFDEAHFLFSDAPKALVQKIEQTVRLIRSKGVGIYFVTQSPSDIPDTVLAQLSGRVQHALRAYTPAEQKAVRAAAQSFRPNPAFKTEDAITELGTGEALVSFLGENGAPQMVEQTAIICPQSLMAACDTSLKDKIMNTCSLRFKYDTPIDNESAYEILEARTLKSAEEAELARQKAELEAEKAAFEKQKAEEAAKAEKEAKAAAEKAEKEAAKAAEKAEKEAQKAAERAEREAQKAAEKAERDKEKAKAEKDKAADRRKAKIETQLISTGGQLFRRGLFSILKLK